MFPKDNKAFNMMLSVSEKDDRGKSFKVITDAVNKMQKSPKAKNILDKRSHKSKTEKMNHERNQLFTMLDRYEELESGNIQIADFGGGQKSVDWGGKMQKSGRYGKNTKFRPATKDELSSWKESLNHKLKELGVIDIKKREKGVPSDVILKDVKRFRNASAFMEGTRIFMPKKPLDAKGALSWDKTYAHELGHQKRSIAGEFKSQEGKHWHDKPEEQEATRDAVNMIKQNFANAGLPFDKIGAYRLLKSTAQSQDSKLETMKNPSRSPFLNRMEFLPTSQSYFKSTGYDNPGDYMDALNKSKSEMMSSGLDIRYPKIYNKLNVPSSEIIKRNKTYWDIVNE